MRLLTVLGLSASIGIGTAMVACGDTVVEAPAAAEMPDTGTVDPPADDAGIEPVAYPAPHSALPKVANMGGPVLATPKIIPVFFPGFGFRTQVVEFASKLGKSNYWKAVTSEFGVGPLTAGTPIHVV